VADNPMAPGAAARGCKYRAVGGRHACRQRGAAFPMDFTLVLRDVRLADAKPDQSATDVGVKAGVAAYAARIQGSRPYAPIESGQRGAQYRVACWRLILIPVATRLSPHTARLRKTPGRPFALPERGSAVDSENAVVEHRRCRLRRSRLNLLNARCR